MPFWKADEPATRWRRLGRNTRDALGSVADETRSRRPPRAVRMAAVVALVAAVVWVARSVRGRAASEESSGAGEPAPGTAASPATAADNGASSPEGEKDRAAS